MREYIEFPIRGDKLKLLVECRSHLFHKKTKYQAIDIYDTEVFGKVLLLDGHIQLTEFDEKAYHEALVHIPMLSIPKPKSALVIGGGDGGVLRELCKYQSVNSIVMVEIDEGVIAASKQFLPAVSAGAFDDARVELHIGDAFQFINSRNSKYDLIVLDITDVYEEETGELSEQLFTKTFYADLKRHLSETGFVVTQADNLVFCPYSMKAIRDALAELFPKVGAFQAIVPSFGGFSGYCWASLGSAIETTMPRAEMKFSYLDGVRYAFAMHKLQW